MSVTIRPAASCDLDRIAEIERDTFSDAWTRDAFCDLLADSGDDSFGVTTRFLVAVGDDDVVCGYICARSVVDEGEILNVAVASDSRRGGIGRALLREVLDGFDGAKVDAVYLEVRESNVAARSLYESMGFAAIGVRKRYYTSPTEDAVVMCRCFKD